MKASRAIVNYINMSSSDSYYISLLNAAAINMHGYGDLVIYVLGIIGHLLSIAIFLKKKWRKNVCVFYFLICLLIGLVFLTSTVLTTAFTVKWNISHVNSSVFLCKLMFYMSHVTASLVPTILILASIDRLLISSQNVDTRLYSSRRLAYLLISTSVVFWALFYIHALVKMNIQQFGPFYFVCYYDLSSFYLAFVSYTLTSFNCLFCLLMIILSVLSFKNVRRIRIVPRQQRREVRSMTKKDFQLLRCLFGHNVVYILFSSFTSSFLLYRAITQGQNRTALETAIVNFLSNLSTFVYFTFYCSSFFIFLCVSKAFRQELKQLIYKMVGREVGTMRVEEEPQQEIPNRNNMELVVDVVSASIM